ncbi:hypothetical protein CDC46_28920, partial (plasmid) [Ralstonia solanacearum]|uniref:hypothetical protein n=1 Tax=Ralstonia solanacearum TaxID=305 RepID=UPI001B3B3E79
AVPGAVLCWREAQRCSDAGKNKADPGSAQKMIMIIISSHMAARQAGKHAARDGIVAREAH